MGFLGSTAAVFYKNVLCNKPMAYLSVFLSLFVFLNMVVVNRLPLLGWLCASALLTSLNLMTFSTYLLVEDRANGFKLTYKVMGLRRHGYFLAAVLSSLLIAALLQLTAHLIGLAYRAYKGQPVAPAVNEPGLFAITLLYNLQLTFAAFAFSYCFRRLDTARSVAGLVYPLVLYYTAYVVLLSDQPVARVLSPFTEFLEYCLEVGVRQRDSAEWVPLWRFAWPVVVRGAVLAVLALYLENVVSYDDDHGKHPLFFLRWCLGDRVGGRDVPLADQEVVAEAPHENTIQVRYLSKKFGQFVALRDVNVDLSAGQIHCLLGHNGAGKSTFINILIGVHKATSGRMTWRDRDITRMHHNESGALSVGVCPPANILYDRMTVRQHLRMMTLIRGVSNSDAEIDRLLVLFNLLQYADYKTKELSGGNKRKLTIALALVGSPQILLFDEPTSALDPVARKDVWDVLAALRAASPDRIILLTTHHLEEAEKLADNIIFLASGTVKLVGSVESLKRNFGMGFVVEVAFADHQSPERLADLKTAIERAVGGGHRFGPNEFAIEDRLLELKVPVSERGNAEGLLAAIRSQVPPDAFVSIGTNTLERAYIEIDRTLHQDALFTDEKVLAGILERLHPAGSGRPGGWRALGLVAANKLNFLVHNILELLKIVAQYLITGASTGFMVWVVKDRQIPFTLDILRILFFVLVYFEVGFSTFSVFNLVYDAHKDIRGVVRASGVSPLVYFAGKLAVDLLIQTLAYGVVFAVLFALLWRELEAVGLTRNFVERVVALAGWKVAYFAAGTLFYRLFSTPKNVTYYWALFYILVNVFVFALSLFVGAWLGWANDLQAVIKVLSWNDLPIPQTLAIFGGYTLAYLSLALLIENWTMIVNFRNQPGSEHRKLATPADAVPLLPTGPNADHLAAVAEVQAELRQTVAAEETRTLDPSPKRLKVTNLTKRYWRKKVPAVNDVNMCVPPRVNFGLIGPNGAGKSTVFNVVLGKVAKTSGNVWLDRTPNYSLCSAACPNGTPYTRHRFGICFQGDSIWDELTVRDNLDFHRRLHGADPRALDELLLYFEFEHYLDKSAGDLSSGNKRKLCILASLLADPDFLLFDEATCGIDINMRLRLRNLVQFFKDKNGAAGIFTTHFLKDIEIFCDKIGIIDRGEFLAVDDIRAVKRSLGGYLLNAHLPDPAAVPTLLADLARWGKVKVVAQDAAAGRVRLILAGVDDVFGLFFQLMEMQRAGRVAEFGLNQLSIEDIYLDVFNRSE